MTVFPALDTKRLRLRAFTLEDAADVRRLASEKTVADTTLRIPHPYPDGAAETWIATHVELYEHDKMLQLAITLREDSALIGSIGLEINRAHHYAELGYWIGVPYWGKGFATEAARAVVTHAFDAMQLHRVFAHHMVHNTASGKVLENLGMKHEGVLREHIFKEGRYIDIALCGMTRQMYDGMHVD